MSIWFLCSFYFRVVRRNSLADLLACVLAVATIAFSQAGSTSPGAKSEFIAPGIEHIQITRGYTSDKEATGPWFINMLRID